MLTAELLKNLSETEIKENTAEVEKAFMDTVNYGAGFVFVDKYRRLRYRPLTEVVKTAGEGQEVARLKHLEESKCIGEDQC